MMKAPNIKTLKKRGWYHEREPRMPPAMLRSEAFLTLTDQAKVALLLLLARRTWIATGKGRKKRLNYQKDGLKFPASEAKEYGINHKRVIRQLVEHGFIIVTKEGGQFHGHRECAEYSLIDDWQDFGTDRFVHPIKEKGVCFNDAFKKYSQDRVKKSSMDTGVY